MSIFNESLSARLHGAQAQIADDVRVFHKVGFHPTTWVNPTLRVRTSTREQVRWVCVSETSAQPNVNACWMSDEVR